MSTRIKDLYRQAWAAKNGRPRPANERPVVTERPMITANGEIVTVRHNPTPRNPTMRGSRRLVESHHLTVPHEDLGLNPEQAQILTGSWR